MIVLTKLKYWMINFKTPSLSLKRIVVLSPKSQVVLDKYVLSLSLCIRLLCFVQVLAFTMMGIIVNAGSVLKYVTMALLVIVYMHDCYNNVYENYLTFNKTIIDDMIERTTDDLRRIASMPSDMQENAAFLVRTTSISFWLKLAELQLLFRFVPVLCFTLMFLFRLVMVWDFF